MKIMLTFGGHIIIKRLGGGCKLEFSEGVSGHSGEDDCTVLIRHIPIKIIQKLFIFLSKLMQTNKPDPPSATISPHHFHVSYILTFSQYQQQLNKISNIFFIFL